jgi:hypothetical protein
MRVGRSCREQARPPIAPRPGRRAFLRMGAACAVPLFVGGPPRDASGAVARSLPHSLKQTAFDPVLDHIRRELVRTYHGMLGPGGIRGEHVRGLSANLELFGVCLQSRAGAARADDALRQRIEEKGREATAQECLRAYDDLAVEINLQYGVVSRADHDVSRAAAALDSVAAQGVVSTVRGHRAALNRLAAALDRAEAMRGAKSKALAVRQKPGDDFMGYSVGSALDALTLCQHMEALSGAVGMLAAFLALLGDGPAAAALALAVEVLALLKSIPCRPDLEH